MNTVEKSGHATRGAAARGASTHLIAVIVTACTAVVAHTASAQSPVIASQGVTRSMDAVASAQTDEPAEEPASDQAARSASTGDQVSTLSAPRVLPMTTSERPDVWRDLFTRTFSDAKRFPSKPTLGWLTIGAVAAATTHPADSTVGRSLSTSTPLHEVTESGAYIGSTPIQLGLAATTYFVGRATQSPRMIEVGAELVRAELLAEGLTFGIKEGVRRQRPEGSGFAFPSGHTTVSFASATVLQRHFGWTIGAPAYALATYVAVSRVQMKRHYLSDVAFGAALGVAIGHTVSFGPQHRIVVSPVAVDGGSAVQFSWLPKR